MSRSLEEREQRHQRMLALVREDFAEADAELVEAEAKIHELRERRRLSLAALKLYDPEAPEIQAATTAKKPGPKKGTTYSKNGQKGISEDALAQLREFVEQHGHEYPDGFMAPDLLKHPRYSVVGAGGTRAGLDLLAAEGLIRLDRIGHSPTHADAQHKGREGKIYKLTDHAPA